MPLSIVVIRKSLLWMIILMLIVPASLKLISIETLPGHFDKPDPVLGIGNQLVFIISAIIEIAVAYCLASKRFGTDGQWLAFGLAIVFIFYHKLSDLIAPFVICPCLGALGKWLGLSREFFATLPWFLLLAIISHYAMVCFSDTDKKTQSSC